MIRITAVVWIGILLAWAVRPASADEALLRRAFTAFMRSADELRIEAIPDLYDGGFARISVNARRVQMGDGLRIDEVAIRLVGVSLDLAALRGGTLKVLEVRDSAMQVRILLKSLQDHFNAGNPLDDIRLWSESGYLRGTGTVMYRSVPTRMQMKGFFAASGTNDVYFYFESVHANGLPLPTFVIREIERQINPVVHQREWPVQFKIRTVQLDAQGLTVSTQASGVCATCGGGGGEPQIAP
jgi:DUF2993 family protein